MSEKESEPDIDKDIENAGKALLRASQKARKDAIRKGTPIVIYKDGQVKKEKVL